MANNHLLLGDVTSYKINPFDFYPVELETVGLTRGDLFARLLCLRKALPHALLGHLTHCPNDRIQRSRTNFAKINMG